MPPKKHHIPCNRHLKEDCGAGKVGHLAEFAQHPESPGFSPQYNINQAWQHLLQHLRGERRIQSQGLLSVDYLVSGPR